MPIMEGAFKRARIMVTRVDLKILIVLFLSMSKRSVLFGKQLLAKGAARSRNLRLVGNQAWSRKIMS